MPTVNRTSITTYIADKSGNSETIKTRDIAIGSGLVCTDDGTTVSLSATGITVNGHAGPNITLTAADVGADTVAQDILLAAALALVLG